jgi:hypothetical protein
MLASENDITRCLFEQIGIPPDQIYVAFNFINEPPACPTYPGMPNRIRMEIEACVSAVSLSLFHSNMNMGQFYVNESRVKIADIRTIRVGRHAEVWFFLYIDNISEEMLGGGDAGELYDHINSLYGYMQAVSGYEVSSASESNNDPDSERYHENMPGMTIDEFQK